MEEYKKFKISSIIFYIVLFGEFTLLAFYSGCVPYMALPALGANLSTVSPEYPPLFWGNILYPYGVQANEGFIIHILQFVFRILGIGVEGAWTLTNFTLFLISFIAIFFMFKMSCRSKWISLAGVLLVYINPFINGHRGLLQVYFSFLFIPLCILTDMLIWEKIYNASISKSIWKKLYIVIILAVRLILVSFAGYTTVIMAVGSCAFWGFILLFRIIRKENLKSHILFYLRDIFLPWVIAVMVYYILTPSGTTEIITPIEFFNGQSVDLVTLFMPGSGQLISKFGISFSKLIPEGMSLTGDGNSWQNYLGWVMIIVVLYTFVRYRKKIKKEWYICTIISGMMFLVALGPGIKFLGITSEAIGTWHGYMLPLEDTLLTPWHGIYDWFPFSMMRANYRWIAFPMIFLILAFINCVAKLVADKKEKKIGAIVLLMLAVIEYYPLNGFLPVVIGTIDNYNKVILFEKDVISEIEQFVPPKSKVVMCTYDYSSNGYLAPYIVVKCDLISYTGAGDKSKVLANNYIPKVIHEVESCIDTEMLADSIIETFEKKLCDYIILPYYSLRDSSYNLLPISEGIKEHSRNVAMEVKDKLNGKYNVFEGEYHLIVEKNESKNGFSLLQSNYEDLTRVKDKNKLFNSNIAFLLQEGENLLIKHTDIGQDNKLYLQIYMKSQDSLMEIPISVVQYDGHSKMNEEETVIMLPDNYELIELEWELRDDTEEVDIIISNGNPSNAYIKEIISQTGFYE